MANVTVIPATVQKHSRMPVGGKAKRKVAGYARVSADSEEQLASYKAQVDYYTHYIRSNPDREFVNVHTDEGISALNTRHRDGFNSMVSDALAGKIDLIVTKSVSRFARNTVNSLTTIRKLKGHGVEVYFEKEAIWSFDGKGELLLTIMSSLAQEESRSISDNVTWEQRKRFADGKVNMPFSSFLGYRRGKAGKPVEFGAKPDISVSDGWTRPEYWSFDAYNEATKLIETIERYRAREGHYPECVLADKIYRNRETSAIASCMGFGSAVRHWEDRRRMSSATDGRLILIKTNALRLSGNSVLPKGSVISAK